MLDPSLYETPRLTLRRPLRSDAAQIFHRVASDLEVTRFVGWPRHLRVEDTEAFSAFSEGEWAKWPIGPLLIVSKTDGAVLGLTGLAFETPYRASTGFVLARSAWSQGFASDALNA